MVQSVVVRSVGLMTLTGSLPVLPFGQALQILRRDLKSSNNKTVSHWVSYGPSLTLSLGTQTWGPFHPDTVSHASFADARKAGISGVGSHAFRDTHVSLMLQEHVNLKTIGKD